MKIHPSTRRKIEEAAAVAAIEAYEQKHLLGKYAPKHDPIDAKPREFPRMADMYDLLSQLTSKAHDGRCMATNEDTIQHFEVALNYLYATERALVKATTR